MVGPVLTLLYMFISIQYNIEKISCEHLPLRRVEKG